MTFYRCQTNSVRHSDPIHRPKGIQAKLRVRIAYANRHGYDIKADFEGAGPWHKLNMIESAIKLERFDWIWWIDFDTLITNTTIKVTDIIEEALEKHPNPNSVSMIFTPDWCGLPKRFLPCSPISCGPQQPLLIYFFQLSSELWQHDIPRVPRRHLLFEPGARMWPCQSR